MANLSNFIYCLGAERVQAADLKGDSINALGILAAITPEFVPGTFSFSIIFTILDVDTTQSNKIQIIFADDGENIIVDSGEILLPTLSDTSSVNLPQEYKGLNMCMDFRNVIFEKEGIYNTQILFNGSSLGGKSIYVKGRR